MSGEKNTCCCSDCQCGKNCQCVHPNDCKSEKIKLNNCPRICSNTCVKVYKCCPCSTSQADDKCCSCSPNQLEDCCVPQCDCCPCPQKEDILKSLLSPLTNVKSNHVVIGVSDIDSLRRALAHKGPRRVIFANLPKPGPGNVGVILRVHDHEDLLIEHGDLELDGSYAKYPVTIYGAKLQIENTENVTIKNVRIRLGAAGFWRQEKDKKPRTEREAIEIVKSKDITIEHCSLSWGTDETLTVVSSKRIFLNHNIISEPLNCPKDPNGDWLHSEKNPHGYSVLIRGSEVVMTNNLIAHSLRRHPSVSPDGKYPIKVLVCNNLIHGYGDFGTKYNAGSESPDDKTSSYLSIIGNYYGHDNDDHGPEIEIEYPNKNWRLKLYKKDNYAEQQRYHRAVTKYTKHNKGKIKKKDKYNLLEEYDMKAIPAKEVKDFVLAEVGAFLPYREAIDLRIIKEVQDKKTHLIDHESEIPEHRYYPQA